ncbi:MATE family efflux transporter [Clostridium paraputrificum]|uniref:MATE family efflux transporter n=1 Tax=Clostridium TaxID=1485 RepID=UPI003D346CD5
MKKHLDLVSGGILRSLIALSLPILGTSFIQMAYNMTDMIWIGRVGSEAVAAVGTAGFFPWLGMALVFISKVGIEVGVSQSIGKGNKLERDKFIVNSVLINMVLAIGYTIIILILKKPLIGFFNLGDTTIINMANEYLVIVILGTIFSFINPIFTSIFTASGNSKTPFIINTVGLIFNMIFDPLLIFGFGSIPALGVSGAAIATVLAQVVVTGIFVVAYIKNEYITGKKVLKYIDKLFIKNIVKLGMPACIENGCFTLFSMVLGRIAAQWGASAIAIQKVGSQIEAISWMTAGGFGTALTTFIGQNYGARKPERIKKGFKATIGVSVFVGLVASIVLIVFGREVFTLFIPEAEVISGGVDYLRILGYSQIFMCIEITTSGAFRGLGNTSIPSIVSILFTAIRIPLAMLLSMSTLLGIDGVWWSISITSVIKGIIMITLYYFIFIRRRKIEKDLELI